LLAILPFALYSKHRRFTIGCVPKLPKLVYSSRSRRSKKDAVSGVF